MKSAMLKMHTREHQLTCIWHPDAKGDVLESLNLGNIRVLVGEPAYQVNTGDIFKV